MSEHSPSVRACPLCGKPTEQRFRPFCSKRCADIDLGRWLKGSYSVPAAPDSDDRDSVREESDSEGEA